MQLLQKLLNKFNGLYYTQEYLCLAKESFQQPLHVYLIAGKQIIRDITDQHLFTGYSPLIFTLYSPSINAVELTEKIDIFFSGRCLKPNEFLEKKDAIACLSLKEIRRQSTGDMDIVYYEAINGEHHFLSSFHQYIIALNNRLYNKKPGNVYLHNNLYSQVQIAYSVPRVISLITVTDGKLFNLFPTDLHGPVNEQYYISSLRHEGKACKQVEASGRVVISQVHCDAYKAAYLLGKNHVQELRSKDNFPFGNINSSVFQFPLPQSALYYRELELMQSLEHGIHKLLLLKIVSRQVLSHEPATLAHVHNVYATWRRNNGLPGNYLLR
jgi:flavin reductase (DIM6/NTAB) family NADH-FMN oxidoreductase RutF